MNSFLKSQPLLIILSSVSGGGKSSLAKNLIAQDSKLSASTSVTTRAPREGETEGIDYYFYTYEKFEQYIEQNKFLETTKIYNSYYGTLVQSIDEKLASDQDVIFDIDWHGAAAIKEKYSNQAISIFILPPSLEILKQRLDKRDFATGTSSEARLKFAHLEIMHASSYDYLVANNDFNEALANLQAIIVAERARRLRIMNLDNFLNRF